MAAHEASSPVPHFTATLPLRGAPVALSNRARLPKAWRVVNGTPDPAEQRKVRHARRLGLVLMIGSSLFSLAVLYGIVTLLVRAIANAG
jgi:hypothetical protein